MKILSKKNKKLPLVSEIMGPIEALILIILFIINFCVISYSKGLLEGFVPLTLYEAMEVLEDGNEKPRRIATSLTILSHYPEDHYLIYANQYLNDSRVIERGTDRGYINKFSKELKHYSQDLVLEIASTRDSFDESLYCNEYQTLIERECDWGQIINFIENE